MARRVFVDAPAELRCSARITLRDGTHAQCASRRNDDYYRNPYAPAQLCMQHSRIVNRGDDVVNFHTGTLIRFSVTS